MQTVSIHCTIYLPLHVTTEIEENCMLELHAWAYGTYIVLGGGAHYCLPDRTCGATFQMEEGGAQIMGDEALVRRILKILSL